MKNSSTVDKIRSFKQDIEVPQRDSGSFEEIYTGLSVDYPPNRLSKDVAVKLMKHASSPSPDTNSKTLTPEPSILSGKTSMAIPSYLSKQPHLVKKPPTEFADALLYLKHIESSLGQDTQEQGSDMKNRYEEFMKKVNKNRQQFLEQLGMQQNSNPISKQCTFQDSNENKSNTGEMSPSNADNGQRSSSLAQTRMGFQFEKAATGQTPPRKAVLWSNQSPPSQKSNSFTTNQVGDENSEEEEPEQATPLKSITAITLEFEVARARKTAALLEEKLQLKDQQITELREKLQKTTQQLRNEEKCGAELQATRKRNSELEEEAEQLREKVHDLEESIKEHEKTHHQLNDKIDKAKEFAMTVGSLASEQEEKYKTKFKELADALAYQKQVNDELSKKAGVFNRDLKLAADKIERMEALIDDFNAREKKYLTESKFFQEENEKKDAEIQKLKATLNEGELYKLRMLVSAKITENEKMKDIIQTMKKDLKELKSAKEDNLPSSPEFGKGRKNDLAFRKENEVLRAENERLRLENELLRAENQQLKDQTAQLDALLKEINQKINSSSDESTNELKITLGMLGSLRIQTQELREENKHLKQNIAEKEKALETLKNSVMDDTMSLNDVNNDQDLGMGKQKIMLQGLRGENEQPKQDRREGGQETPDTEGGKSNQINLFNLLDNVPKM